VRIVLALGIACAALTWSAASAAEEAAMDKAMDAYFTGEQRAGGAALALGLTAGGIGAGMLADEREFTLGLAIPLIAAGSLQAIIGTVLLARTSGQLADLRAQHARDPAAYRNEELPRMERVNGWFGVYKVVWLSLIGVGAAGVVFGTLDERPGFVGAGLGLTAEASATIVFDVIAEDRAAEYTEQIRRHTPTLAVGPGGVTLGGSF
jgi:hypothetical protein